MKQNYVTVTLCICDGHRIIIIIIIIIFIRRKFEPRVRVWKLKEEKTCEEYRCMVGDKVEEVKWKGLGVNDHWQQMKGIMMETAQDICEMTKGVPRHKETWWWSEEVAEAVRNKKIKYGKWKKENTKDAKMEYKKSRQNAKRVISSAKEKKQKERANDLLYQDGRSESSTEGDEKA